MSFPFDKLPKELHYQIYGEVLPVGKIIHPFGYPINSTKNPNIVSAGILQLIEKVIAKDTVRLYPTNTVHLQPPSSGGVKVRQMAMSLWRRYGPSMQSVHMNIPMKPLRGIRYGYRRPGEVERVKEIVGGQFQWERAALEAAAVNNLQTLTIQMNMPEQKRCVYHPSGEYTASIMEIVQFLLSNLAVWRVTMDGYTGQLDGYPNKLDGYPAQQDLDHYLGQDDGQPGQPDLDGYPRQLDLVDYPGRKDGYPGQLDGYPDESGKERCDYAVERQHAFAGGKETGMVKHLIIRGFNDWEEVEKISHMCCALYWMKPLQSCKWLEDYVPNTNQYPDVLKPNLRIAS